MDSSSSVDGKQENNSQNDLQVKIDLNSNNTNNNQHDNQDVPLTENNHEDASNQPTNSNEYPLLNAQVKERNKKRKFTQEEDEKLRELVQDHGQKQWDVIARNFTDRTARQCRDRWKHYLSPSVTPKKDWTITEDRLLLQCTQKYGAQWAALVKFFPGRTDINLKNRWNKLQRKSKKLYLTNPNVQIPKLPANPEHIHFLNTGNMILNQNQNINANATQNDELPQPLANIMPVQTIGPITPQQVSNDNNKEETSNAVLNNNNNLIVFQNVNENNDQTIDTPESVNDNPVTNTKEQS